MDLIYLRFSSQSSDTAFLVTMNVLPELLFRLILTLSTLTLSAFGLFCSFFGAMLKKVPYARLSSDT